MQQVNGIFSDFSSFLFYFPEKVEKKKEKKTTNILSLILLNLSFTTIFFSFYFMSGDASQVGAQQD